MIQIWKVLIHCYTFHIFFATEWLLWEQSNCWLQRTLRKFRGWKEFDWQLGDSNLVFLCITGVRTCVLMCVCVCIKLMLSSRKCNSLPEYFSMFGRYWRREIPFLADNSLQSCDRALGQCKLQTPVVSRHSWPWTYVGLFKRILEFSNSSAESDPSEWMS